MVSLVSLLVSHADLRVLLDSTGLYLRPTKLFQPRSRQWTVGKLSWSMQAMLIQLVLTDGGRTGLCTAMYGTEDSVALGRRSNSLLEAAGSVDVRTGSVKTGLSAVLTSLGGSSFGGFSVSVSVISSVVISQLVKGRDAIVGELERGGSRGGGSTYTPPPDY